MAVRVAASSSRVAAADARLAAVVDGASVVVVAARAFDTGARVGLGRVDRRGVHAAIVGGGAGIAGRIGHAGGHVIAAIRQRGHHIHTEAAIWIDRSCQGLLIAIGVGHHRRAIEHQRILPADHVEIGNRRAGLAGALRQQVVALRVLVAFERRGIRHQQQLRALRHGRGHRLGEPQVLADHHADRHALDLEHAIVAIRIDVEIAALVEHRVVRQFALAVGLLDAAVAQHAGGVVHHAARRLRPTDHGDDAAHVRGDFVQRRFAIAQERRPSSPSPLSKHRHSPRQRVHRKPPRLRPPNRPPRPRRNNLGRNRPLGSL